MIEKYRTKFNYTPPIGGVKKVFICGSFNDWKPDEYELKKQADNYEIELELPAGKYSYKFIVDGHWLADETANYYEDDNRGGRNSIVYVGTESSDLYVIPIEFVSETNIKNCYIAGSFNDWNPKKNKLEKIDKNKFKLNLLLPKGEHEYKLIVNNEKWITDPKNSNLKPDDRGGKNSVLSVDENSTRFTGNEAEIFTFGLVDDHFPIGEEIGNNFVRFACKTYRNNVDSVQLIWNEETYSLNKYFSNSNQDFYSLILNCKKNSENFQLKFIKKSKTKYLNINDNFFHIKKQPQDLGWIRKSVIYQIFCDRFKNGNPKLNQNFREWYYDPKQNPLSEGARKKLFKYEEDWSNWQILKDDPQKHFTFFGGDLIGVIQKIPYLKELGVNCIYFNPLVESASNHKYDTYDYFQIDPHFGGNSEFMKLVEECHQIGIKVILDFAFNHVGLGFFAFQDCLKHGKKSNYFNWFDWYKFPLPKKISNEFRASDYYQCWWGHADLPDLNFDLSRFHPEENYLHDEKDAEVNEPLVDHLLDVAEFWIKDMQIDGFRLDVPNEVPFWFWKQFRAKVKELKPDAYLVGEIWHNAEEWLDKYFDAVMNYSYFREPMLQFFALHNWDSGKFLQEMLNGLHHYGFAGLSLMMNLLDSHDTHRFLEAVSGDIRKLKLAVLFQMSWIGVPHIFYGDEVGLRGGDDPDNRRPMNWNYKEENTLQKLHDFYSEIIKIRNENECLIYGDLKIVSQNHLVAFERVLGRNTILVLINNSDEIKEFKLKENYCDLISESEESDIIIIKEYEGRILKRI
ncbi:MAG: hypothetical protein K9N09_01125 [Candidatus Cloacimonetes bacterium]|nr:hypothetical protein [Candidatus Cloacimonadota bacterium]MCF7812992.1 hypothetical protein [Candidatus Cloacimonadota bacterium]MCF7867276.1 hypothetical protein [Candidatus Cloacimonadota bacterium]MCF7882720.1 hypothetical protein [Candidatus Cloacimonadota bacterium]